MAVALAISIKKTEGSWWKPPKSKRISGWPHTIYEHGFSNENLSKYKQTDLYKQESFSTKQGNANIRAILIKANFGQEEWADLSKKIRKKYTFMSIKS